MTTTTRKPAANAKTAAELYAEAEEAARAERDLAERRRAARQAAEVAACRDLLDGPDKDLYDATQAARLAWDTAVEDDSIGIDQLFALWVTLRQASAVRAAHVAQTSGVWDRLEPLRHGLSGQPITHRADVHDSLDPRGEMTWALALEAVIQKRAANAAILTTRTIEAHIRQAGIDAAQAIS
jgi:hypothetical protein